MRTSPITIDAATRAIEANFWSNWAQFGRGEGCTLVDTPELLRFATPIRQAPYNAVVRTRLGEDADDVIADVLADCSRRQVPATWLVHPSCRPHDLGSRLEAHGLSRAESLPGMAMDLADVPSPLAPPDGIEVREVGPDDHSDYVGLLSWRYGLPLDAADTLRSVMATNRFGHPGSANRAWVACRGDDVLCKVTLHVHEETAGIYGVATHTEARGLGLARLLTLVALDAARAAGATLGVLQSSPMATSLYERMGFTKACEFHVYSEPGALHV